MSTTDASQIHDLRSALDFLCEMPGQLLETDTQVDPDAEVSGVYRYVGAGGTVMRPTKEGPAMVFNNVKGFDDAKVCIGMLASRKRVAALLDLDEDIDCREVVYKATDEGFDLRKIVPAPTNTPVDGGPYITMGLAYGTSPDGSQSDVTIHRFSCVDKDKLAMWITPGSRHLGAFFDECCQRGEDMPISISIGLDPAVYMCCGFEAPTTALTSCRSPAPCAATPSSLPTASPFRKSALPMPSTCSRATSCTTRPSTRTSTATATPCPSSPATPAAPRYAR